MTQVLTSTFAPALSSHSKGEQLPISVAYPFNLNPVQPQASLELDTLSMELNSIHPAASHTNVLNEREPDMDKNRGIMQRLIDIYRGKSNQRSTFTHQYPPHSTPSSQPKPLPSTLSQPKRSHQKPRAAATTPKSSAPIVVAPCSESAIFYL